MKAVKTDRSNVALTHPDPNIADLPVERVVFHDDEIKEAGDGRPGFESTWEPDDGERRALANGAPVLLRVWGREHPPVGVRVGDPPEEGAVRLISRDVVDRAAGAYFAVIGREISRSDQALDPGEALAHWETALAAAQEGEEAVAQLIESAYREVREDEEE